MKRFRFAAVIALCATSMLLAAADASAASIRLSCEKRGTTRSKVSVDGRALVPATGTYFARISSGGVLVRSKNNLRAVAGEAEFDFDSNAADVRAGATAIRPTFIRGSVTAWVYNVSGRLAAGPVTVACRVR